VADWHTYFVGCDEWGFSVWAHNADCAILIKDGEKFILKSKVDGRVLAEGTEADVRAFAKANGHDIAPHGSPRDFDLDPPEGFSYDPGNPSLKTVKRGDSVLDYHVEDGTLHVDWTEKNLIERLKDIQGSPDGAFRRIEGYTTAKLGEKSDAVLLRAGRQAASQLEGRWEVTIHKEGIRRFLVFTRLP